MNKRNLPLIILEALQPYLDDQLEIFKIIPKEGSICYFQDLAENSKFYFSIQSHEVRIGKDFLKVDYSPLGDNSTNAINIEVELSQFKAFFDKWIYRIKRYNSLEFIQDPILKTFQDDYYQEFELADDPSNNEPLKINQLYLVDGHLAEIEDCLPQYKNDRNSSQIDEIIQDARELRLSLTDETKISIVKKISKIWAKMTKAGMPILKEFLNEAKKDMITKGVQYLTTHAAEIASKIIHLPQ